MILIVLTTNRQVEPMTVLSLVNMARHTKEDVEFLVAQEGYTIAENRNFAVAQAKKKNASHLLFIDDDMIFPVDTLDRLLAHQVQIVGVKSNSRKLPLTPTVGLLDEKGEYQHPDKRPPWFKFPTEFFECYFVGAGVMLIDMKVFETIDKPYFHFDTYDFGMVRTGEDGWFCQQARNKGIKIYCDPQIEVGHIGKFTY